MRALWMALICSAFVYADLAWANGGGGVGGGGSVGGGSTRSRSPAERAEIAHNDGVKQIEKATRAEAERVAATDERKREKFANQATAAYTKALKLFRKATDLDANLYQAWNYVGYCERKLGNYDAALLAYDQALAINPDYGEAVEYRGQAYLLLNRIEEAKGAYMQLYVPAPALADQLMAAMRMWVDAHRADAAGLDPATVEAFGKWVSERETIAGESAALGISRTHTGTW